MKKRIWLLLLSCIAAKLLLVVNTAIADDAPIEIHDAPIEIMGGGASPMSAHPSIRMDSEEVTITLGQDTYTVDAVFHFFNTGATTTESVGFPKHGKGYEFSGTRDFVRFETWVNGQKVRFIEHPGMFGRALRFLSGILGNLWKDVTDNRWMVKQVTFPARSSTTTRVQYEVPYHELSDDRIVWYIYGTGSYWKDTIGKATFTIDCDGVFAPDGRWVAPEKLRVKGIEKFKTTTRRVSETAVTYEVTDFEPEPDDTLSIWFSWSPSSFP